MAKKSVDNEKNPMQIINDDIKSGDYKRVYLLHGDEKYLINQYRDKLLGALTDVHDTMNYSRFTGDKINAMDIVDFCETMPFLADRRVVLVEDSGFFKKSDDYLPEKIEMLPDTAVLIFVESEVDKRNRLYKACAAAGATLCFTTPDERTLTRWICAQIKAEGKNVEETAVYRLIEATGSDMNLIKNELDKLIAYAMDRDIISLKDVETLCVNNVEGRIFEMTEAISRKQKDRAIHLYHVLLDNKEPAMRILFLITRQYDMMLKVKLASAESKNDAETASLIGVPSWSVKKYREQCKNYSKEDLIRIVELCQQTDYQLKTSQISDVVAVEVLIVSLIQ